MSHNVCHWILVAHANSIHMKYQKITNLTCAIYGPFVSCVKALSATILHASAHICEPHVSNHYVQVAPLHASLTMCKPLPDTPKLKLLEYMCKH